MSKLIWLLSFCLWVELGIVFASSPCILFFVATGGYIAAKIAAGSK